MGMDLSGEGGYFRWTSMGWRDILTLGEKHGWVPTGTGPPKGMTREQWGEGIYYSNDGQLLYARDAKRLAHALEKAISVPPDDQTLSADQIQYIQEFIAFCRAGSFRLF